jgi:CubicO group peptidase (beta-lactamase class C family)
MVAVDDPTMSSGAHRRSAGTSSAAQGSEQLGRRPIFPACRAVGRGLGILAMIAGAIVAHAQPYSGARVSEIERGLAVATPDGVVHDLTLDAALRLLNVPSVSLALIEGDRLAWALAYGPDATPRTLYQAASLSKTVTAVAALRLVQEGRMDLDQNVNARLTSWRIAESDLTRTAPVTLRGLLSMTGGVGVPGYLGYHVGAPLPSLIQILDGAPPANSPPVTVIYEPGTRYFYSGGGYEIVEALIQDTVGQPFETALRNLVLDPLGMRDSTFAYPLPNHLAGRATKGHLESGQPLPGGWRVVPELAAGGLWSTPSDLAKLLIDLIRAFRADGGTVLDQQTVFAMLTPQHGFSYGLGGAVSGAGANLVFMKRGQNVGYQAYMMFFPETGQGVVIMTGSDNGTRLAEAMIRRIAELYRWPSFGRLQD